MAGHLVKSDDYLHCLVSVFQYHVSIHIMLIEGRSATLQYETQPYQARLRLNQG